MAFRNPDFIKAYATLMEAKANIRNHEDILEELKGELSELKADKFLIYALGVLNNIEDRTYWQFEYLMSPMRQVLFLIDVYFSISDRSEKCEIDQDKWLRITRILSDIEMNYFASIGFSNDGDYFHDERDAKVAVSLPTFMNYFCNAQLSYDEQTLWRLEHYCGKYDKEIQEKLGFRINDICTYITYLSQLNNNKLTQIFNEGAKDYVNYIQNPEEWRKLTAKWTSAGLGPDEWIYQSEMSSLHKLLATNPGEVYLHNINELRCGLLSEDVNDALIQFLFYDFNEVNNKMIYYAADNYYASHPLVIIGDNCFVPHHKFLYEAFYNRIDYMLSKHSVIGERYKRHKDSMLEDRVMDILKKLFRDKAHYYKAYTVDGVCEQDIMIEYKGFYFVIEVKDCNFREPMRDPIKAFDKINKDFQKAIQKGYEQCRRVERVFEEDDTVEIRNAKDTGKLFYSLNTHKVKGVFSIVVTQYKYNSIQTNLADMLQKEEGDYYPWSVCADDLEAFVLLLRKLYADGAARHFIEFIKIRESFHGHLICSDELELCGFYLCEPKKFKELSNSDSIVCTFEGMTDIFDAYYQVGLGFENEINVEVKKEYPLKDYARNFDFNSPII